MFSQLSCIHRHSIAVSQACRADTVALALHVVLDRLSPRERVAFVLHDSFGFEFPTIASFVETSQPRASWPREHGPRSPSPIPRTG